LGPLYSIRLLVSLTAGALSQLVGLLALAAMAALPSFLAKTRLESRRDEIF
jgi:hypothetical protein